MPESRPTNRPRISLEQLLKLKRSERPDAAFWEEFDCELRRRQLASVVATPTWRVRFARSLLVGVRRAVPISAAAAAAVGGFMILQRPAEVAPATVETAAIATPGPAPEVVVDEPILAAEAPAPSFTAEPAQPVFRRPAISEPRYVVNEFVAKSSPARAYVSVTSPNTFSSPAYDASLQMVNTLTSGYSRRADTSTAAGSF